MKSNGHTHRYEKVILGNKGYTVFRCNLPGCSHYIRKELAKGKLTLCNRCGNEMTLDSRAMNLTKPHCVNCIKKKSPTFNKIKELVSSMELAEIAKLNN